MAHSEERDNAPRVPVLAGRVRTTGRAAAATSHPAAAAAAVEILKMGGNAVDAAVAASWALAVCEPSGSGLGGQSTLLLYLPDGRIVMVDGHSYAPEKVSTRRVRYKQQKKGYRACTIPSTPATLGYVQDTYGRMNRREVMVPAIRLAEDGVPVTELLHRHISWCRGSLAANPAAAELFLKEGRSPEVGDILRQEALARTLRRLADRGIDDFYSGEIAKSIAKDMKRNGGLLRESDLSGFRVPVERRPIGTLYRGLTVVSVPPPGGGVQVLLGLRLLEAILPNPAEASTADWYESLARVVHVVFREREKWPIHPDTLTPSVSGWLLSDSRVREIVEAMEDGTYSFDGDSSEEPGETSHLCVADSDGMVVSLTQSIQSLFGAKVANRELGFLYNNYLWTCPRGDHPYRLKSGCLPMSNAAPTMIFRDGVEGPVLALGSAGSRRITSSIFHVISGVFDRGADLEEAVDRPRVHAILGGDVWLEGGAASEPVLHRLSARYRSVEIKPYRSSHLGAVQAVGRVGERGWTAAADPRREGTATVVEDSDGGSD